MRKFSWFERIFYGLIFAALAALIFGVDTAPHFGPTWIDDVETVEASR